MRFCVDFSKLFPIIAFMRRPLRSRRVRLDPAVEVIFSEVLSGRKQQGRFHPLLTYYGQSKRAYKSLRYLKFTYCHVTIRSRTRLEVTYDSHSNANQGILLLTLRLRYIYIITTLQHVAAAMLKVYPRYFFKRVEVFILYHITRNASTLLQVAPKVCWYLHVDPKMSLVRQRQNRVCSEYTYVLLLSKL